MKQCYTHKATRVIQSVNVIATHDTRCVTPRSGRAASQDADDGVGAPEHRLVMSVVRSRGAAHATPYRWVASAAAPRVRARWS